VEGSCCNGGALPSGQMFSFGVKKGKKPVKPVVTPEQKLAYQKIAANHAEINGLSKSFVFAIIEKESSWNPKARSPTNVWGIMQVTQDTMKKLGWIKAEGSRLDPEISIKYGTKYLKKLMDMYGDEDLAAAGYSSAGPAVVSYALKYYCTKTPTYECVKKYLEDTEALVYVQKVNSFKQQYAALIASGTIKV
jgi:soluble lytic murein transglycosylase-like protein